MLIEISGLYIFSYLLGSIPSTYLAARFLKNTDIREYGSGNAGASNASRLLGRVWGVALGLFDVLAKGSAPVVIGWHVFGLDPESSALLIGAPLLALAGHNWSIFLRFQGGRGITIALGSMLILSPFVLMASLLLVGAGWALTRNSGVWVLVALVLLPVWTVIASGLGVWYIPASLLPVWTVIAPDPIVVIWYGIGVLTLVVLKRLLSNWTPLPAGLPKKKVLFNRLFLDRDVDNYAEWVHRSPRTSD